MKHFKRTIVLALVVAFCMNITVPYVSAAGYDSTAHRTEKSVYNNEPVYETNQLKVTFHLEGQWDSGYNAKVKIKNISHEVIHDWYISFAFDEVISNIWNAEIFRYSEGKYIIKNAGWNQDIKSGDSVDFGFSASEKFSGYPEKYEIVNRKVADAKEDYTVKYHLDNDWQSGFQGSISITNNMGTALEDWTVEFDFDRTVTSVWNAVKESHDGNHYVFGNSGYNSDIKPGETVSFGFVGTGGDSGDEPRAYKLYSYKINSDCAVSFDGCAGSVVNVPAVQNVVMGTYAEKPDEPVREGYYFMGWYADETYKTYFDFETMEVNHDITLYARWLNLFDDKDMDGDGIGDSLEEYIGTDRTKKDTDGDGVFDYTEIVKLDTDPTVVDTDRNGICDGEEDFDKDGLSNGREEEYNTDPALSDTDDDNLNDFKEIYIYGTDPNKEDTDGDTLTDGDEVKLGLDPLKKDTNGDGVPDCDEIIEQELEINIDHSKQKEICSVGVQLSCSGLLDNQMTIENVYDTDVLSSNVAGLVGVPVNVETDAKFDEAIITFTYDESKLGDTREDNLCMMWYDEVNDTYVLLEDCFVNTRKNTVSYKTTHFSTYLVVDKERWFDALEKNAEDNFDIIKWLKNSLSGKGTSSVYKCYETGMTWDEAEAFCEEMGGHLVTITSADEQAIVESLIQSEGSKNNYWIGADKSGNSNSFQWVTGEKMSYTKYKDGYADNYGNQEDALMIYRNDNPRLWGWCRGYWNDLNRNGTCMGESFFGLENMGFICEWDDVNVEDTDNDGVMDILEEGYMLSNGQVISSDPTKADTDGDGLSDGEEMGGTPEVATVTTLEKEYVILVWHAISDPNKIDSDDDGLYDNAVRKANGRVVAPVDPDSNKLNAPKGIWDSHVRQQEIGTVSRWYHKSSTETDITTKIEKLSSAIREEAGKINVDVPDHEELATAIVEGILTIREDVNDSEDAIRQAALLIKMFCNGKAATIAGAYLLNFVQDENQTAYHSRPDTWQRYFGYNQFYDEVFEMGSRMHKLPIQFSTGSEDYMLWMWKGDYWNLHSGAEMGLYVYSGQYSGVEHYNAVDFEVPMTLSLYNYYGREDIDNIFSWSPVEKQWWITGFSGQKEKFLKPDRDVMISVGSVDLSEHEDMYTALKKAQTKHENLEATEGFQKYLLFDDEHKTVWVMWYEGVQLDE